MGIVVGAYYKAAAALVAAVFALLVLRGNPRQPANRFLAFFLFLIAGNQALDAAWNAVAAASPAWGSRLYRLASVFAALDPLMLYYFASVYPERNALNRWDRVLAVFAPGAALALLSSAIAPYPHSTDPGASALHAAWAAYTSAVYLVVLGAFLRHVLAGRSDRGLPMLLLATSLAAIPTVPRAGAGVLRALDLLGATVDAAAQPTLLLLALAAPLSVVAAAAWRARRRSPTASRTAVLAVLAGEALALMVSPNYLKPWVDAWGLTASDPRMDPGLFIQSIGAALRWIAFAALVSMAVLRHDMLGMTLATRRRAARALVALGGTLVGVLAVVSVLAAASPRATAEDDFFSFSKEEALILAVVALVASVSLRPLVDRVAARVYGVPVPGDAAAAAEAYHLAAAQLAREGRRPDDPDLERLREELGIDPRAAEVLARMAEASATGPLAEGRLVAGRYRVTRLLGKGGHGRTFLAWDELLRRHVVLKEAQAAGPRVEEEVLREARTAGMLQHPNVVVVHDVLRRSDGALLVVEFVPGGSLADRVAAEGPVPPDEGLRLLDGVLAGLAAVHAQGVVHRDLKPENVLLTADGSPKIGDFGVARVRRGVTVRLGEPEAVAGTPEFMAPEVRRGEAATPASDVYAVGLIASRCVGGPVPPDAVEAIRRALLDDPAGRPSAAEMRDAIRRGAAAHAR